MPVPPLEALTRRLRSGDAVVAGVLSGTSGDGIDVALCRFPGAGSSVHLAGDVGADVGTPVQLAFESRPFEPQLAQRVREALDRGLPDLARTALLSRDLGRAFGAAAREVAREHDLELELVGSHGQTVFHHDGTRTEGAATLQLGDGDFVAQAAGACAASDFRQADIAAGGEGAPLSALADELLFADLPRPSVVLNLGGIANVSFLGAPETEGPAGVQAFDTGPAGSLLDGLARRLLDAPFDSGGAVALTGTAHAGLVSEALEHPFIARTPPKSTGRDTFGEDWVDAFVERAGTHGVTGPADLLASAVAFIARHIGDAVTRFGPVGGGWLVVCGGGARNAALMDALARGLPLPVCTGEDFGVDPDAREALVFAVLAARCALGLPSTDPAATGARAGQVLGKLSQVART